MKLTYFDLRGKGEPIRFILAAAGRVYEDRRIAFGDWPGRYKNEMPWGQLPVLETDDGVKLAQSMAICRYVAKKHQLTGKNDTEAAKCDEYVDSFEDLRKEWHEFVWEKSPVEKKSELKKLFLEEKAPAFFSKLNAIIKHNGGTFLVGEGLTWADIYITCNIEAMELTTTKSLLQAYPDVVRMRTAVENQSGIRAWIDKRPAEDLLAIIKSFA